MYDPSLFSKENYYGCVSNDGNLYLCFFDRKREELFSELSNVLGTSKENLFLTLDDGGYRVFYCGLLLREILTTDQSKDQEIDIHGESFFCSKENIAKIKHIFNNRLDDFYTFNYSYDFVAYDINFDSSKVDPAIVAHVRKCESILDHNKTSEIFVYESVEEKLNELLR